MRQMRERLHMRDGVLVEQRPWSAEELARARKWRRELLSASQIGRLLKRSRNSVIAKLWRDGEPRLLANAARRAAPPTEAPRRMSWEAGA